MKITFLGSGGGRFSAISQRRMTGGFRIDNLGGKNYHIDPGPGALIRTYQFGFDPRNLSGVFVSHAHTDHYNDAEILIEAMTRGMTKSLGTIVGSESVLDGYDKWGPAISKYHQSKPDKIILKPGEVQQLNNTKIKGTATSHGDPTGVGFQIDYRGFKLSYTADTAYFDGLADYHKGADILIASVLRPGNRSINGHMCSKNFIDLINEVKPQVAVMTHLGLKMISSNPVTEAKKISKKTGVKTIAAYDGLSFNVNYNNPKRFRLISLKDVQSSIHSTNHALYQSERKNSYQMAFQHKEFDEMAMVRKNKNQ
ncbi:MAG: MBL fold metallo-hydrolase [Methanobrevibacter sp.]|uniref:MBL fold metallo-hydrolase n=1 Tax=Methanobrevibacter sp. TaxID=66852 RepID=UPI0025E2B277|nr:MBL fold metallo-hydrolase [Methanobrevibacter sp.]MBQ8017143.1 MBL fold metallo-hydrolase [Methanobrevibacter sp.]